MGAKCLAPPQKRPAVTVEEGCKKARHAQGGSSNGPTWRDIPFDIQLLVLDNLSLAELARLAPLGKVVRAAFKNRVKERQACIEARLAEGWATDLMKGVSPAEMALPRDLIVTPPLPERLQLTPGVNRPRCDLKTCFLPGIFQDAPALPGVFRGFALRGKPDGRGEWVADCGDSYTGDWRGGLRHGHGTLHDACLRCIGSGEFQAGVWIWNPPSRSSE